MASHVATLVEMGYECSDITLPFQKEGGEVIYECDKSDGGVDYYLTTSSASYNPFVFGGVFCTISGSGSNVYDVARVEYSEIIEAFGNDDEKASFLDAISDTALLWDSVVMVEAPTSNTYITLIEDVNGKLVMDWSRGPTF